MFSFVLSGYCLEVWVGVVWGIVVFLDGVKLWLGVGRLEIEFNFGMLICNVVLDDMLLGDDGL